MTSSPIFALYHVASNSEEFKRSSSYVKPGMFENHDSVFYRIAESYFYWAIETYKEKWVEYVGENTDYELLELLKFYFPGQFSDDREVIEKESKI